FVNIPVNMKAKVMFCCWICFHSFLLIGQECDAFLIDHSHHTNHVQARLNNDPNVFLENLINPFIDPKMEIVAYSGLWLTALDEDQNIRMGARGLNHQANWFASGPHPQEGELDSLDCVHFNKIFTASRSEIEALFADLADNGQIDQAIPNIMGWPAQGNPHFESIHGSTLPDTNAGFAPFHDANNDGLYNPEDGDFPLPTSVSPSRIPEEIVWWIGNDRRNEQENLRMDIEIQATAWSFLCTEVTPLNQSLFINFKIVNYSDQDYTNFRMGHFNSLSIGCDNDDYFACLPDHNSFYVYNFQEIDEPNCFPNVPDPQTYEHLPTLSVTFLNQELAGFAYLTPLWQPPIPFMTYFPANPTEYNHFLNGRWKDGSPMTFGGDGTDPSNPPTSLLFPGLPTDLEEWSMLQAAMPARRRHPLGTLHFDQFNQGDAINVAMAYSVHYRQQLNHLEQIAPMIDDIETLQSEYDNQFEDPCTLIAPCETDCVWLGDANNDGIANYQDLLAVGLAYGSEGPERFGPLAWHPTTGNDWDNSFLNGVNFKHADCNGNGAVEQSDFFEITQLFYNSKRSDYEAECTYPEGNQLLLFDLFSNGGVDTIEAGEAHLIYRVFANYGGQLHGLAFELEYDTAYFEYMDVFGLRDNIWIDPNEENALQYARNTLDHPEEAPTFKFANSRIDGQDAGLDGLIVSIRLKAKENLPAPPATNQTTLRFKNVRAQLSDGSQIPFGGQDKPLVFDLSTTSSTPNLALIPIDLYPNPVKDQLFINWNGFEGSNVELLNIEGRLIQQFNTFDPVNTRLDLPQLPSGMYFLKVYGEDQVGIFKFILE
ncbi:MAG: T9SS type A sorting domain-containing protein, partial [Bacteroidota bacterium]